MTVKESFFNGAVTRELVFHPVARLHPPPFNPPIRSDDPKLNNLRRQIDAAGGVLCPVHAVRSSEDLRDGTRRVIISNERGTTHLWTYLYDGPQHLIDLIVKVLNTSQAHYTKAHWVASTILGGPTPPAAILTTVKLLTDNFSQGELESFVYGCVNLPPTLVSLAQDVADRIKVAGDVYRDVFRVAFVWLVNLGQQGPFRNWRNHLPAAQGGVQKQNAKLRACVASSVALSNARARPPKARISRGSNGHGYCVVRPVPKPKVPKKAPFTGDRQGLTAFEWARANGHLDVEAAMRKYEAACRAKGLKTRRNWWADIARGKIGRLSFPDLLP
jgi:hypothetical protein